MTVERHPGTSGARSPRDLSPGSAQRGNTRLKEQSWHGRSAAGTPPTRSWGGAAPARCGSARGPRVPSPSSCCARTSRPTRSSSDASCRSAPPCSASTTRTSSSVRDLVVDGNDLALVMDLVRGTDLRTRLDRERRLAPEAAVAIVADVADGLAAAHARRGRAPRRQAGERPARHAGPARPRRRAPRAADRLRRRQAHRLPAAAPGPRRSSVRRTIWRPRSSRACRRARPSTSTRWRPCSTSCSPASRPSAAATRARSCAATSPRRSSRSPGIPEELWQLLVQCLAKAPASRLRASELGARLRELLPLLVGMPPLDVDEPDSEDEEQSGQDQAPGQAFAGRGVRRGGRAAGSGYGGVRCPWCGVRSRTPTGTRTRRCGCPGRTSWRAGRWARPAVPRRRGRPAARLGAAPGFGAAAQR